MRLYFSIIICILIVGGCTNKYNAQMAKKFYELQSKDQKPVLSIEAKPGETIAFSGVKRFEVYGKSGNQGTVKQYRKQYHPAWSIVSETLRYAAPAMVSGYWATELVDSVGKYAGDQIGGNRVGNDYTTSDNSVGGNSSGSDYDASDSSVGGDSAGQDYIGNDYDTSDNSDNSDNSITNP